MKIYIYVLKDPTTKIIKYVGQTKSPKNRLRSHIDLARWGKRKRAVGDWINTLLNNGKKPLLEVIEETSIEFWAAREIYWISYYKSKSLKLLNLTNGGESNNGYKYSNELKEVRKQARIGWVFSEITKNKISQSLNQPIVNIDDNIIYESMKQAISLSGVPKSTFHRKFHKGERINGKLFKWYNENNK